MVDPNDIPYWKYHPDYRPGKAGDAIRRLIPRHIRLRKYPPKSPSNTKVTPKQLSLFELSEEMNKAHYEAPLLSGDSAS